MGTADDHRIDFATPLFWAAGADAAAFGSLAGRGDSRHPRRPTADVGGHVPGSASGSPGSSLGMVTAGAIAVLVFPGAERRLSRTLTAENNRRHQRCRAATASYSGFLRRIRDRNSGGHL